MSNEFAPPGGGDHWAVADAHGHLVVIDVLSHELNVTTTQGPTDAIAATVHDITNGTTHEDVLIFPKVLKASLKNRIGQKVLAVIGQGVAKPGQSAPWVLEDKSTDPASVTAAKAYLEGRNPFTAPTAEAAAAPAAVPAPAAPAAGQPTIDLTGKTPEQVAALREMGLA